MRNVKYPVALSMGLLYATYGWGGTVVETRDDDGQRQRISIEGQSIRIESDEINYLLIDMKQKTLFAVDAGQRRIVDMSSAFRPQPSTLAAADKPGVRLLAQGGGPVIADYQTTRYKVMSGNRECGETFLSKTALDLADLKMLFDAIVTLNRQEEGAEPGLYGNDACDEAGLGIGANEFAALGVPMRTVTRDGYVDQEVVSIKTGVAMAPATFTSPSGFDVTTMEEIQDTLQRSMQESMMPEEILPDDGGAPAEPDGESVEAIQAQMVRNMQEMMRRMRDEASH